MSSGSWDLACLTREDFTPRLELTGTIRTSFYNNWQQLLVEPDGPLLKLSATKRAKHVGILVAPLLGELTQRYRVTLTTTPVPAEHQRGRDPDNSTTYSQQPIWVLVYGFSSEQGEVAKALSQGNLFLQDPYSDQMDPRVPYTNPQYLLRPGTSMPEISELAILHNERSPMVAGILSESEKDRILQIFQTETRTFDISGIQQSPRVQTLLKDHQLTALAFMVEKEFARLDRCKFPTLWTKITNGAGQERYRHVISGKCEEGNPDSYCGGILADDMGLGKTLTTLALVCWNLDALDAKSYAPPAAENYRHRQSLIVTPKSTIHQWQKQIETHITPGSLRHIIYHGSIRHQTLENWDSQDVILTTYDTLRSEWQANGPLFGHSWGRVVLDEAHTIRNRATKVFQAVCDIRAQSRWCLTGTPIQNRLEDFGALLSFLRVPPFFTQKSFELWITRPVKMKQRNALRTLRNLVRATCLRRMKLSSDSSIALPRKTEKVMALELSEEERELYKFFQRKTSSSVDYSLKVSSSTALSTKSQAILSLIGILRLICDHGQHLLPPKALSAWEQKTASRTDWNLVSSLVENCDIYGTAAEKPNATGLGSTEFPCSHIICGVCSDANETDVSGISEHNYCPKCLQEANTLQLEAVDHQRKSSIKRQYKASTKVEALMRNLRAELSQPLPGGNTNPFKSIVFSYWTRMLDLVQIAFETSGLSFTRIDGQTSLPKRMQALDIFNNDPDCQIMLASIGSIGEGVDLTAANHVHILEPQWNPMTEAQAVDRIHRIGQQRDVIITRYVIQDSIEDYVRWVQKNKLILIEQSLSVSDPQQLEMEELRRKLTL
ncbi:SNF2 family N-terminal domain-containing protein [Rhexocercosporidium sp. MPI-PUGE-AT-0058]|nr:SNF2 family N-terminal domain-containing protein [Rhexocercosporidium sp. MPI-PUGE-AT-0058]